MIDTRQLSYFCAIVEHNQISRAAKALGISQPALSLTLKELEDELAYKLINRDRGNWMLTDAGKTFYLKAQQILTQLASLSKNPHPEAEQSEDVHGEVRIGSSGFTTSYLKKILPKIESQYPNITTRFLVAENMVLENKLQQTNLDFAILQLPLYYNNYITIRLQKQYYLSVWSPLIASPPNGTVTVKHLVHYPILLSRRWENTSAFRPFISAFQEQKLTPRIILDSPHPNILLDALFDIPAVAIVYNTEIPNIYSNCIKIRPVQLPNIILYPAIVWKKGISLSPQSKKIVELLCMEFDVPFPQQL